MQRGGPAAAHREPRIDDEATKDGMYVPIAEEAPRIRDKHPRLKRRRTRGMAEVLLESPERGLVERHETRLLKLRVANDQPLTTEIPDVQGEGL